MTEFLLSFSFDHYSVVYYNSVFILFKHLNYNSIISILGLLLSINLDSIILYFSIIYHQFLLFFFYPNFSTFPFVIILKVKILTVNIACINL